MKGTHFGMHQNPNFRSLRPHDQKEDVRRRCGVRLRVHPRPFLQDETTNGKNGGEKSCTSDLKRRALAKGKLVFISYLLFSLFNFFCTAFVFPHCIFENFQNCFLHAGIFLAIFPFHKKCQK